MSMIIRLERIYNCPKYCIGHLYADGQYVCDTIEDTDRGLDESWTLEAIRKKKVMSQTAIPTGTYKISLNIVSPKFSKKEYYMDFCGGRLPRLMNVKGFDGILIHKGVNERSSAGCLIVGYNTVKGQVTSTQQAFEKLYGLMKKAEHGIRIEIMRKYKV